MRTERKRKRGSPWFYAGLSVFCVVFSLVLLLIRAALVWRILLIALGAGLFLLSQTDFWRGARRVLFWAAAVFFAVCLLFLGRPDYELSLSGTIMRESVRFVMNLPFMKGSRMLEIGLDFTSRASAWQAPRGYALEKIDGPPYMELLSPEDGDGGRAVLLIHGGSFIFGYNDIYRDISLEYARRAGASVLSVDYRTAPEHIHPAALLDCAAAWEALLDMGYAPEKIVVAGDSAGGNLALSLCAYLIGNGDAPPAAIVALSPWADVACAGDSYLYNLYNDPTFGLPPAQADAYIAAGRRYISPSLSPFYAGDTPLTDPSLSPVYGDFSGFPPLLLQAGTWEMLESDSLTVHEKALAAGADSTLSRYEGMFHAFQIIARFTPEGRAAWREIGDFVRTVLE